MESAVMANGWEEMEDAARRGQFSRAVQLAVGYPPMAAASRNPGVRAALERIMGDYSWVHFRDAYDSDSYRPLPIERLSGISRPTLVLMGDEDVDVFRTEGPAIANHVSGAELRVIEHSGHMVNMERPAQFNSAVLEFLG
jgi:pimeloyl-ACP methyl ester carboxylesterase